MTVLADPYDLQDVPPPSAYERALAAREAPAVVRAMLLALYEAPGRTLTAGELACAVGLEGFWAVNFRLGLYAARLCATLDRDPDIRVAVLVRFSGGDDAEDGLIRWTLIPEVATAMENLQWTHPAA